MKIRYDLSERYDEEERFCLICGTWYEDEAVLDTEAQTVTFTESNCYGEPIATTLGIQEFLDGIEIYTYEPDDPMLLVINDAKEMISK